MMRFTACVTEYWHETVGVRLPLVTYDTWTANLTSGDRHRTRNTLAFRPLSALVDSLAAAGFADPQYLGNWDRSAVTAESPEIIVIAKSGSSMTGHPGRSESLLRRIAGILKRCGRCRRQAPAAARQRCEPLLPAGRV